MALSLSAVCPNQGSHRLFRHALRLGSQGQLPIDLEIICCHGTAVLHIVFPRRWKFVLTPELPYFLPSAVVRRFLVPCGSTRDFGPLVASRH
jgi:hypothetical protein